MFWLLLLAFSRGSYFDEDDKILQKMRAAREPILKASPRDRPTVIRNFIRDMVQSHTESHLWYQPENPPTKGSDPTRVNDKDEVWFLDVESGWWMTGQSIGLASEGRAKVSPTAWPGSVAMTETPRVLLPDRTHKRWISEKIRDLANMVRDLGDFHSYRELLLKAAEVDPTNPHPLDNLGIYYSDIGNGPLADHYFNKSIEVEPDWWHSYSNWGIIYRDRNDYETAKELFQAAFVRNPLHIPVLDNLGHWNLKNEDLDSACVYYWIMREITSSRKRHVHHLERTLDRCDSMEKSEL